MPARNMSLLRAGILSVDSCIGQTIERHRRAAGGRHAKQNADEIGPAPRDRRRAATILAPRHYGRQQCERQREQRVAEADEFEEVANAAEHMIC